jgi:hypothetical protein
MRGQGGSEARSFASDLFAADMIAESPRRRGSDAAEDSPRAEAGLGSKLINPFPWMMEH